jgi:hypothetical protein
VKTSILKPFAEWLLDGGIDGDRDNADFVNWLSPNFQSYADGDSYRANPNGVALTELMKLLKSARAVAEAPERSASKTRRLLLVSSYAPSVNHAGGLRLLDLYAEIRKLSPSITIDLYCPSQPTVDGELSCGDIFDEVFLTTPSDFSFGDFLLKAGGGRRYDVADFQFHGAGKLLSHFSGVAGRTLFTPMECTSRATFEVARKRLRLENHIRLSDVFSVIHATLNELKITTSADQTVCVSDPDAAFLASLMRGRRVDFLPTGLSELEFSEQLSPTYRPPAPSAKQKRLVFAAYFGSDTNVAGLTWFLDHAHPHILRHCPDYKLLVVGRGDLSAFIARGHAGVTFIGEVPVMAPVFDQARAGLVLALHGSGFRGKVNQYAVCGLPSISTALGLTGLAYEPGVDIVVADDPVEFALACVRVLVDDEHCDELGRRARATALANYQWGAAHQKIRQLYCL